LFTVVQIKSYLW